MEKTNSISIGNSGEYFVAAELERNGFIAAVPMSNTKNFDILAINKETNKQVAIQVKTNHTSAKTWTLSEKNEHLFSDNIYYVFVSLNELAPPDYYIINSELVAKSIKESHSNWIKTKKSNGTFNKDTSIRKFSFEIPKFNPLNLKADYYKSKWNSMNKKYYELTKYIPYFESDNFGEWYSDLEADGSPNHPFHFPCFSYKNEIDEFASAVREFIDTHPEMNLNHFKDILNTNNIDTMKIKEIDVSVLDGQCVCAMIVANVLAEKFCEGAILDSCKDGSFLKWLNYLKDLDNRK